jgi:hypothetical protein
MARVATRCVNVNCGVKVLPGCACGPKLTAVGDFVDAGFASGAPSTGGTNVGQRRHGKKHDYLSTARLRELGIITEQGRVAESDTVGSQ